MMFATFLVNYSALCCFYIDEDKFFDIVGGKLFTRTRNNMLLLSTQFSAKNAKFNFIFYFYLLKFVGSNSFI